jgi:hypothetical protein
MIYPFPAFFAAVRAAAALNDRHLREYAQLLLFDLGFGRNNIQF